MPGLPLSWKEFASKPVIAVLYIALFAIGGLYVDQRQTKNNIIADMKKSNTGLTVDNDLLKLQLRKADSTIADMNATLRTLKQVGKIQ